jgi:murein DD-endopeptidase MepM/ murein hydrolase activator NlpD
MRFRLALAALAVSLAVPAPDAARARPGDVPAGYAAAQRSVAEEGRALVRLIRAGDAETLHARFAPELAAEISLEELGELLDQVAAAGPVGARLDERAAPLRPGLRAYTADHRWGERTLAIDAVTDGRGAVTSLRLAPRAELPPDPGAGRDVTLRFPLPGTWWVMWGGATELRNYHAVEPTQRHALDLVQWRHGGTARGAGTRNADFHAWNAKVVAPAGGVVAAAVDGLRDNTPMVETDRERPAGNHVVVKAREGVFVVLAHLRKGSVRVRAGDRVRAGQVLGRVGNSGNSSEPHLHVHADDGAGAGLPLRFGRVRVDGEPREHAALSQGSFVTGLR